MYDRTKFSFTFYLFRNTILGSYNKIQDGLTHKQPLIGGHTS